MLKQLSRLERTRNIFIIGFIVLMAVSLVFFYKPGGDTTPNEPLATSKKIVATVGGEKVTLGELVQAKEQFTQRFGGQIDPAQFGYTDRKFLDQLIQQHVVSIEAVKAGLSVSDAELREQIFQIYVDPATKRFVGEDRYREIVTSNGGDLAKAEQSMRDGLAAEKLRAFISSAVTVSDQEVVDDYKRKNTSFELSFVVVSAGALAEKLQPSDQDLHAYFDQHKAEYHIDAPQKLIRYLYINQEQAGSKLNIPDADLKAEFDKLDVEHKQAGVKVQQIVLKVADARLDASVKAKADEIVAKARGASSVVTEEAFAELARGTSEDPATAKDGGFIKGVVRKNPNNPTDPLQQTLDMAVGAITEPIKFGTAYYILRRGDSVPKTFEDAKSELLVSLRNRRAFAAAAALANKAADQVKAANGDVAKVAAALAAEANMTAASMVKETGYIIPGDDVKDIGVSQQFEDGIAGLTEINQVGERTQVKEGFAIPVLAGKKDPRDADFDEVKDKIATAVKAEKAAAATEQTAKDILAGAKTAGDLKTVAVSKGLTALTAKDYKIGSPLTASDKDPKATAADPSAGSTATNPVLDDEIFGLKEGELIKAPAKSGVDWVIVGASKRTDADMNAYATQKQDLTDAMLSERRGQVFNDYITAAQERMKQDGTIKIFEDVLAELTPADNGADGGPGGVPGGMPGGMPGGVPGGAPRRRRAPMPPQ
jgi:peptidyl-prolyl cis-trans isomerase D